MKLLFENWRQYLKEEEEPDIVIEPGQGTRSEDPEEEEETYEDKLTQIFLKSSPRQAIELGRSLPKSEVGQELLIIFEEALSTFHDLMKLYRDIAEHGPEGVKKTYGQYAGGQPARDLYYKFSNIIEDLAKRQGIHLLPSHALPELYDRSGDPRSLATRMRTNIVLMFVRRGLKKITTKDPAYVEAVDWAGELQNETPI